MKVASFAAVLGLVLVSSLLAAKGSRALGEPTDYIPPSAMLAKDVKALLGGPLSDVKGYLSENISLAQDARSLASSEAWGSPVQRIFKSTPGRILKVEGKNAGYQHRMVYVTFNRACESLDCALVFQMNSFAVSKRNSGADLRVCDEAESSGANPCYNQLIMVAPDAPQDKADTWAFRNLGFFVKRNEPFDMWGVLQDRAINQQITPQGDSGVYARALNPPCVTLRNYELVSQTPLSWCYKDAISLRLSK